MEKRDYIIDQIEKIAQLIAALMGGRKVESECFNQAVTDLTGLDSDLFIDANTETLGVILKMLDDDNRKALIAKLLLARNPERFGQMCNNVMSDVDLKKLSPRVRALLEPQGRP